MLHANLTDEEGVRPLTSFGTPVVHYAILSVALLGLIGFANAKALYCTAPDWTTSMNSTTAFCNVSGKHYCGVMTYMLCEVVVFGS